MKLNLIEDSIKIQEREYEKKKIEREHLKKQFQKLYSNNFENKNNNYYINKNKINTKKNENIKTNNSEFLSKIAEKELNITKNQMNILDKESSILYNKYKKNIKIKYELLKRNNHSENKIFLSKQGTNIIKNNKYLNNKFIFNNNKEIRVPTLLNSFMNKNKRNIEVNKYYKDLSFSPKAKNVLYFFKNFNDNIIKHKKLHNNYFEIF